METTWNFAKGAAAVRRLVKQPGTLLWAVGGGASVALVLMSCATSRTLLAPPGIPGATYVGSEECAACHDEVTTDFKTADHAKLQAKGKNAVNMGCEACHGPGSLHVEAGGGANSIINPKKSPETCFQCHLDKKAEFNMPFSHPVLAGKMTCSDCHDPHKGSATKAGGTSLKSMNDLCVECHTQQRGPFVFPHDAVREGCTTCHSPHGSVNQKMLTERNGNLCLKCHFQQQQATRTDSLRVGSWIHGLQLNSGTCWSAGCHEQVHGSNMGRHLRR
jgi:predicted CXXCH cytochrome family protein